MKMTEQEARTKYPHLVIAYLGAIRKDKPNSVVTARVLFDGTHGIPINKRTRFRDQERGAIATDMKRIIWDKSLTGERTYALTADVKKAHRQVPIAEKGLVLAGMPGRAGVLCLH